MNHNRFAVILLSFLLVAVSGSVVFGDFLVAPRGTGGQLSVPEKVFTSPDVPADVGRPRAEEDIEEKVTMKEEKGRKGDGHQIWEVWRFSVKLGEWPDRPVAMNGEQRGQDSLLL